MVIKLKNMSKDKKKIFGAWLVFTVLMAVSFDFHVIGWQYYRGISAVACFAALVILEGAINVYYRFYCLPQETEDSAGVRQGRLVTEIPIVIIAVLLLTVYLIPVSPEFAYRFYSWGTNLMMFGCFFAFLILGGIIQWMLILLAKKRCNHTLKEDSVLRKWYLDWKEAEPFERRIRKEELFGAAVAVLSALAILIMTIYLEVWVWNSRFTLPTCLAAIGVLVGVVIINLKNKCYKDVGKLLRQIDVMSDGNLEIVEEGIEDPDIRRSSEKLCGISKNLKRIMEKQMQAERMKIDLITNVSHDLKTPLTSMVGYIDLLKKEELSAEARDYVEILGVKQEQLKNMIQDIFELSKSTSGTVELELEELDMKKLLEQTLGDMEDAITDSGMEIRKKLSEEPAKFVGDGKKMYRVFQNLISNALKYSLKGTRIYIEETRLDKTIEVSIKNTASYEMDFTEEEVLERFARADKARNTEGHGLGLAIAESFVKNMGGTFEVDIDGDQFKVSVRVEAL